MHRHGHVRTEMQTQREAAPEGGLYKASPLMALYRGQAWEGRRPMGAYISEPADDVPCVGTKKGADRARLSLRVPVSPSEPLSRTHVAASAW